MQNAVPGVGTRLFDACWAHLPQWCEEQSVDPNSTPEKRLQEEYYYGIDGELLFVCWPGKGSEELCDCIFLPRPRGKGLR